MQRAKHLLELHGVDVAFETNTAMPQDFLMQQMELREALEEAKSAESLDARQSPRPVPRSIRRPQIGLPRAQAADALRIVLFTPSALALARSVSPEPYSI